MLPAVVCSPKHDPASRKDLYTVGAAAVIDQGTSRVQADPNRPQLLVTYGVVVAGKTGQQLSDLLDTARPVRLLWLGGLLSIRCSTGGFMPIIFIGGVQHVLPAAARGKQIHLART